jgi:hypothetical protein
MMKQQDAALAEFKAYYLGLDCIDARATELVEQSDRLVAYEQSVPDEASGAGVTHLKGGGFATFSEWQDYTGHGCQCGSDASGPFKTLREACLKGLGDGGRELLKVELATAGFKGE